MQIKSAVTKFKDLISLPVLSSLKFWGVVWALIPIIGYILKIKGNVSNNYTIFASSFNHSLQQLSLYKEYPQEYHDLFLYGMPFTSLIAPFAILPNAIGALLWTVFGAMLLFAGLKGLKLQLWQVAAITLICANDVYTTAICQQSNTLVTALIVLSFALLENKKTLGATFMIMLGAMTKLYGIVGLAFLPFCKKRITFVFGLLFWGTILFVFPMLYTSPEYVVGQYTEWFNTLINKDANNIHTLYTNVSLIGMIHRMSGYLYFNNLWIIIPGLLLFIAPYARIKQYESKKFRMLFLSSTLLFMVLFSTGTEKSGYIAAFFAIGLWYVVTPTRKKHFWLNTALLVYSLAFCSFTHSDIFPKSFNHIYIEPYSLKALPCSIVWFKIMFELLTVNFITPPIPKKRRENSTEHNQIDIILPCYNPHDGWDNILIEKYNQFKIQLPSNKIRFILVNDGSSRGFTPECCRNLKAGIDSILIVDNTHNQGKGAAVRDGLKQTQSDIILYTDYDFPYEVESMCDVIQQLEQGYDIVIATRNHTYYNKLSPRRRVISYGTRILNFGILGMTHTDTQGGLKGFNKNSKKYLAETTINHFLFDTEFIYHASQSPEIKIKEVYANLRKDVYFSDISNSTLTSELKNLLKIATRG